jgi:hypothetical protein
MGLSLEREQNAGVCPLWGSRMTSHCKKWFAIFPSPAGMSLTKLFNVNLNYKLFPARESLVSDILAENGKTSNLFLQCSEEPFARCDPF